MLNNNHQEYLNGEGQSHLITTTMAQASNPFQAVREYNEDLPLPNWKVKDPDYLSISEYAKEKAQNAASKANAETLDNQTETPKTQDQQQSENSSEEDEYDSNYHQVAYIDESNTPEGYLPHNNHLQRNKYKGKPFLWVQDYFKAGRELGLSDNFIKNLITKDAVESKYGSANQAAYNFGNITKGRWKGPTHKGNDRDKNNNLIHPEFRVYKNMKEYIQDITKLVKNLYGVKEDDDIVTFAQKLQGNNKKRRFYATDPAYVSKLQTQFSINKSNKIFS